MDHVTGSRVFSPTLVSLIPCTATQDFRLRRDSSPELGLEPQLVSIFLLARSTLTFVLVEVSYVPFYVSSRFVFSLNVPSSTLGMSSPWPAQSLVVDWLHTSKLDRRTAFSVAWTYQL